MTAADRIRELEARVRELQDELSSRIASEKYVAAAYLLVTAVLLAYLLIHSAKTARLARDVQELAERFAKPKSR